LAETNFADGSLGLELQSLFAEMQSASSAVNPTNILTKLEVDTRIQEDAQEFLLKLLHQLDDSIDGVNSTSKMTTLFEGRVVQVIRCLHVDFEKRRRERFLDLSVDVPSSDGELEDAIAALLLPEQLQDYSTGPHGLQAAERRVAIASLPPLLLVTLKRFAFDASSGGMTKVRVIHSH
jgi:uncharacterized UBP type Zn finger protein